MINSTLRPDRCHFTGLHHKDALVLTVLCYWETYLSRL